MKTRITRIDDSRVGDAILLTRRSDRAHIGIVKVLETGYSINPQEFGVRVRFLKRHPGESAVSFWMWLENATLCYTIRLLKRRK